MLAREQGAHDVAGWSDLVSQPSPRCIITLVVLNTAITVEYGSDLSAWTTAVAGPDVVITDPPGSPTDAVEVKIRRTLAVGDKLFARLKVAVTP